MVAQILNLYPSKLREASLNKQLDQIEAIDNLNSRLNKLEEAVKTLQVQRQLVKLLNLWWLTLKPGRKFMEQALKTLSRQKLWARLKYPTKVTMWQFSVETINF